jgi:hypothetical protein
MQDFWNPTDVAGLDDLAYVASSLLFAGYRTTAMVPPGLTARLR